MIKHKVIFGIFSLLLTMIFFCVDPIGFTSEEISLGNFVYHFFHANIFHLIGNLFAMYIIMHKVYISWRELLPISFIIATICSFFCGFNTPTIGLSGIVYAVYGMHLSLYRAKFKMFCIMVAPIIVMMVLTSLLGLKINNILHLSSYILGCVYSFFKYKLFKY